MKGEGGGRDATIDHQDLSALTAWEQTIVPFSDLKV